MCQDCKNCILNNEYEDLDEESKTNLKSIINGLETQKKVSIAFLDSVHEGVIKFNEEGQIVIIDEEGTKDYLCNLLESIMTIKVIPEGAKLEIC